MAYPTIGEFEEMVLLSVCGLNEEANAVAVQQHIKKHVRRQPTMGAIYTALQRLEEKELVDSWLGEPTPQPGGRRKRYYRSTRKGIAVLVELRNARERLWQSIGPIPEVGLP